VSDAFVVRTFSADWLRGIEMAFDEVVLTGRESNRTRRHGTGTAAKRLRQ